MKCLFIGGPKAGQFVVLERIRSRLEFPAPLPEATWVGEQESPPHPDCRVVAYTVDYAMDKAGNEHVVYVLDGSGDPLIQLMEFYAASKHS